jgi:CheY-like chemotaxis protein
MEAVGRLAGGVAHDFNNILTAITSYAELGLLRLPAEDPVRRTFEQILTAADRAAVLTRQLLAFSRRQVLAPRIMDPNAVVAGMAPLLRRLLGEQVEFAFRRGPAPALISADPAQLEQAIVNLAMNSRDAMPRGGTFVLETARVRFDEGASATHPEAPPGDYLCISVSDTGTGMTEEVRQRVFEPFFSTKERVTGSGLGLAAVYGIVRQSGGHLWFYSEPGIGTTFKLYFPIAGESAEAPRPAAAALPRGTETILVTEDDDSVRAVVVETLRSLGYRVLEAGDPREGIAAAAAHEGPIDLLLTDVVMPGLGGRELYDRLLPARPGLRVLFISGYTDDAIARHGILAHGDRLLEKPFSQSALAFGVREALGGA